MASPPSDLDAIGGPTAPAPGASDLDAISQPTAATPSAGILGSINHYAGLINRGVVQGVTAIPSMVGDSLVSGYNAVAPHMGLPQSPQNLSGLISEGASALSIPQPQNLKDSLVTGAASALSSMAVPVPFLDKLKPGTSQGLLNNSWAQAIGENAGKLTSKVLQSASDRMGQVFDAVRDDTPRVLDTAGIQQKLAALNDEFSGMFADASSNVTDHPLVQKLAAFADSGQATGAQLGKLSSQLGKVSTKQFIGGDADLGDALSQVKEMVDDSVQQGLSGPQLQDYSTARTQYRAFSQLLRSRALNVDTGDVNPSTMGNFLQRTDRSGYALGNNTSDHYVMTHSMRAQNAPSSLLNNFKPLGVPVGPVIQGAYSRGLIPPAVKGAAGAYEGLTNGEPVPQE